MEGNFHVGANMPLGRILDLARWAPSGDNTQPWRFEIVDDSHFIIRSHDTRDWCVYDLEGRASQIAVGALLETFSIAATAENLHTEFARQQESPDTQPVINVTFVKAARIQPYPLLDFITVRSTQRRLLSTRGLTDREKEALEEAVGPDYQVIWLEGRTNKLKMARLLFDNAAWSKIPYSYPHFQASITPDCAVASQSLAPPLLERLSSPSRAYDVIPLYGKIMIDPHSQLMKIEAVDDHHGKQRQEAHEAFNPG